MCYKSYLLIIFLILKGLILIVTPIVLYFLYKKESKVYNLVGVLDIFFIVLFIILKLVGNPCVKNSTFSYLNNKKKITNSISSNVENVYKKIRSTSTQEVSGSKKSYYYSINYSDLKDVKLSCDKKSYIKQYGSSISTITTLIANKFNTDLNAIEVIDYLEDNNLIDCNDGADFSTIINALGTRYHYNVYQISKADVSNYVSNDSSVLVETINKSNQEKNFGCEKDYIVIYNKSNEGYYSIINSNDKSYSYFCPSNTIGYGSIIEGKQNSNPYTLEEIDSKALGYYVIEVKK